MIHSLFRRAGAALLSLVLLAGLCPLAASAANSNQASQALRGVSYYGDYRDCEMPYDMAQAYGEIVGNLSSRYQWNVILADPAGDGMPLLIASQMDGGYYSATYLWTWDGTKAVPFNWLENTPDFGFRLEDGAGFPYMGTFEGKPAIMFDWPFEPIGGGPSSRVVYSVSEGRLTPVQKLVTYRAWRSPYPKDFVYIYYENAPFADGIYSTEGEYIASFSAMQDAGWLYYDIGGAGPLILPELNGKYVFFDDYSTYEAWNTQQEERFISDSDDMWQMACEHGWSTASEMQSALTAYAAAALPEGELPFLDVAKSAYYYDAVAWAVEREITTGATPATFGPNTPCTRAQVVTFLWRAAGSPKVTGKNPFTDVSSGAYYYNAVLWAVKKGITTGTSATTFSPDAAVTRGQTVTFLYRDAGSPAASGSNPFTDVPAGEYYSAPVQWAVANGVTTGDTPTTFAPNNTCTRGQIVTFLYRAAQ